jgi:hypothetical protein
MPWQACHEERGGFALPHRIFFSKLKRGSFFDPTTNRFLYDSEALALTMTIAEGMVWWSSTSILRYHAPASSRQIDEP